MFSRYAAVAMIGLALVSQGCSSSSNEPSTTSSAAKVSKENKNLNDFVEALNAKNLIGEKSEKAFAMVGATNGFAYGNDEFKIEVYEFPNGEQIAGFLPHKNGNFGMQIHRPTEGDINQQLVEVFESFN